VTLQANNTDQVNIAAEAHVLDAPEHSNELTDLEYLQREMANRELARRSFKRYLYYVHSPSWKRTRMSDYLADEVQKFVESDTGNAYDILLIETPPQHGKSLTITESFPSWYLGRYPKNRIIEASYNFDTAERFGRKNLEKVEQFGSTLFGLEKGSVWTKTEFELSNGWGRMISRGIMAGITGNPANLLIIDDPIKNREEADSQTYRDKVWAEWQNTLKSRLAAGAKVIVIMTPWHEDDLAARLLQKEPTTRLLRLPVEAEEGDLLGRTPGDSLAPELGKDKAWLQQFKAGYTSDPKQGGLRAWQALYQCSPRVDGGNLIRREWWKYYDPAEVRDFGATVISVDAAFKGKENNDFVAIQVWSKRANDYYLRYSINKHLEFPETVQAILTAKRLFPESMYILIEDKANGSAIIQTLQRQMVGVIGITPKGGKVSRVNAVAPAIESGHVYLPQDTLWAEELVDQFTAFPAGAHDDMVDACSQCLGFMLFANGNSAPLPDPVRRAIEEDNTVIHALTSTQVYDVYDLGGGFDYY
jgi:predicted phage terminase large subunit-like protein